MSLARLAESRAYALGVLLAVIVALPTLGFGFFADDYLHITTIEGNNDLTSPYDLFVFGTGDKAKMRPYLEAGPYPWFMDAGFKAHFFRPLSSLLMVLDYRIFGRFTPAYHAHSIVWYVLLCLGVMVIFRRTLPPAVGFLALVLFVVDESHAFPVAWWSNRNAVVAVALGAWGLAAHLRWREDRWRPGLPLSLCAFTAALLASENGIAMLAYVLAYELFGAKGSTAKRLGGVLPAACLAAGYLLFYRLAGYGAQHSDIYIDPVRSPLQYLLAAPVRFLLLAGTQFFAVPCDAVHVAPGLEPWFAAIGAGALLAVGAALYGLRSRFDARETRALRWLIPGALMAVTPGLAALVTSRLLLAPSLGGAVVIALIIVHAWRLKFGADPVPVTWRALRLLMWLFLVLHVAVAALSWSGQVAVLRGAMSHLNDLIRRAEVDERRVASSQIVVVNASDPYTGLYPVMLRDFDGLPRPRSWWTLSIAPYDHRLSRTGPREMELEIVNGEMFASPMEKLFRSVRNPLLPGDRVDLNGLAVTVLDTGETGPSRMRLQFEEPPESDRYQILVYRENSYRRITPPEIGEVLELPYSFPRKRR